MSEDIVERANIMAQMLVMGDRISFDSNADMINELAFQVTRLRAELAAERERADRISASADEKTEVMREQAYQDLERAEAAEAEHDALRALLREARDTLRMAEGYGQASFYSFIARIDAALNKGG